jgi:hypothetical protein
LDPLARGACSADDHHRPGRRARSPSPIAASPPPPNSPRRAPRAGTPSQPIATMRSIGNRARCAISAGTVTSYFRSRSASRPAGALRIRDGHSTRDTTATLPLRWDHDGALRRSPAKRHICGQSRMQPRSLPR